MYIKDYEFISKDINVLFEKQVVIYGAGVYGRRTAMLLEDAQLEISCFCDKDMSKRQFMGHPVIRIEELKRKVQRTQCLIVVASNKYCDNIIGELIRENIEAYVCTWYGIQVGIELNIKDKCFPIEFQDAFLRKAKMYDKLFSNYDERYEILRHLYVHPNAVLVYQPGKVGSQTIARTLQTEGVDVIHFHGLAKSYLNKELNNELINEQVEFYKNNCVTSRRKGGVN